MLKILLGLSVDSCSSLAVFTQDDQEKYRRKGFTNPSVVVNFNQLER